MEEVWSQEPRGQVVMITEDHWEETEILKRALDFHKIGSWREEEFKPILSQPFRRGGSPAELNYIHSSLL